MSNIKNVMDSELSGVMQFLCASQFDLVIMGPDNIFRTGVPSGRDRAASFVAFTAQPILQSVAATDGGVAGFEG